MKLISRGHRQSVAATTPHRTPSKPQLRPMPGLPQGIDRRLRCQALSLIAARCPRKILTNSLHDVLRDLWPLEDGVFVAELPTEDSSRLPDRANDPVQCRIRAL